MTHPCVQWSVPTGAQLHTLSARASRVNAAESRLFEHSLDCTHAT